MEMACVSNKLFRKISSSGLRTEISIVKSASSAFTSPETENSFAVLMLPARIAPSSSVTDATVFGMTAFESVPPVLTVTMSPYSNVMSASVSPFAMM